MVNDKHNLELSDFTGHRVSELVPIRRVNQDCLMVVSHYETSSDTEEYIEDKLSTFALEYSKLSANLIVDIIDGLGLKSMSREEKYKYSPAIHNHDTLYSKVYLEDTLICTDSRMTCLADVTIRNNSNISSYQIRTPKIVIPQSDEIQFGTLRFVGCRTFKQFENKIMQYPDGTYNIDIMDRNFDGWVFANGTYFDEISVQVPILSNFLKINNGYETINPTKRIGYVNSLQSHNHGDIQRDFSITGKFNMYKCWIPTSPRCSLDGGTAHNGGIGQAMKANLTIDCSTFRFSNLFTEKTGIDIETKPTRNLMPIMFFIGNNHLMDL